MDTETIDQEYEKLQSEFQDVAKTVQGLAEKMQAAEKAGVGNATAWLADLKQIAVDISDEQTQANALLQAIHGFISNIAQAQTDASSEKPPLFAPGHEPQEEQQQSSPQRGGLFGGMLGGGMLGGPMMGGYFGGGFARAMEMGAGIGLGQSLIGSIFRL
jgi:hypothetical protein